MFDEDLNLAALIIDGQVDRAQRRSVTISPRRRRQTRAVQALYEYSPVAKRARRSLNRSNLTRESGGSLGTCLAQSAGERGERGIAPFPKDLHP
jgi:hypothetical protein